MLQINWSAVTIMLNELHFNSSFNYKIRDKYEFAYLGHKNLIVKCALTKYSQFLNLVEYTKVFCKVFYKKNYIQTFTFTK